MDEDGKESIWAMIYKRLKKEGIDVYSPGQYQGECKSPYVVLSNDGSSMTTEFSSQSVYYSVMCYVPLNEYSRLELFVREIKEIMKGLFPVIRPDGVETPVTLDDELKAHMISVEYINYRKVNYL